MAGRVPQEVVPVEGELVERTRRGERRLRAAGPGRRLWKSERDGLLPRPSAGCARPSRAGRGSRRAARARRPGRGTRRGAAPRPTTRRRASAATPATARTSVALTVTSSARTARGDRASRSRNMAFMISVPPCGPGRLAEQAGRARRPRACVTTGPGARRRPARSSLRRKYARAA